MSATKRIIKKHKDAKNIITNIADHKDNYLIIHYSCESFYEIKDGRSPRVTSIAIRFLKSGQTRSFSIHKVAEKSGIPFEDIDAKYDELEKEMLEEFYELLRENKHYYLLHWNMRNSNYGFEAIQHRFEALGGKPYIVPDSKRVNLAGLFYDRYSNKYADHPRLTKVMIMNNMSHHSFLGGPEEAKAFEDKEYVKLHQSTLKKVDVFADLLQRSAENRLVTKASLTDMYGLSPQGVYEILKDHWGGWIILLIIGIFVSLGIHSLFK
ncbi:hypothetical protein [Lewinella sp. IMCC34191]|uniref:hypothetical protein n=1 Tax=Lewinella sp. IMCC34191 TaxID=2259172 RepID=UPI000E2306D5|nr:hypothetical protein [Lewinella sp. IMCC34191]